MRRTILWHAVTGLVLSGLVTLSSGCRKELCYNHDEHAYSVKVDVTATWEREWERDHGRGWKNTWEGRGWNSWMTYDDLRPEVPGEEIPDGEIEQRMRRIWQTMPVSIWRRRMIFRWAAAVACVLLAVGIGWSVWLPRWLESLRRKELRYWLLPGLLTLYWNCVYVR